MITSKDILKKTGLNNAKTLTRWYQQGIIPKPVIGTHPSGRGKIALWPDWVLEYCTRIIEKQKQGHSLRSAWEQIKKEDTRVIRIPTETFSRKIGWLSDLFESQRIKFSGIKEDSLQDFFLAQIMEELVDIGISSSLKKKMIRKMKESRVLDRALQLLDDGINPILAFDGMDMDVIPDFLVSDRISLKGGGFLFIGLLGPLKKAFNILGIEFHPEITSFSVPKMRTREGDVMAEYEYSLEETDHDFTYVRSKGPLIVERGTKESSQNHD